jgi:hypothetical protein
LVFLFFVFGSFIFMIDSQPEVEAENISLFTSLYGSIKVGDSQESISTYQSSGSSSVSTSSGTSGSSGSTTTSGSSPSTTTSVSTPSSSGTATVEPVHDVNLAIVSGCLTQKITGKSCDGEFVKEGIGEACGELSAYNKRCYFMSALLNKDSDFCSLIEGDTTLKLQCKSAVLLV